MDPKSTDRQRTGTLHSDGVSIRRVAVLAEYEECVRIQLETWGEHFSETVPSTILRIGQEVGGVTAAAFAPDGGMLGFVFGITGIRDDERVHWSDMLAIRSDVRDRGLGKRLKLFQRDLLLEIGVKRMLWTYDPLVSRNAYLNIERLGARPIEYRPNFYGEDTGSVLHSALGTDRFVVSWELERRLDAPAGRPDATGPVVNLAGDAPVIGDLPDASVVRVAIPHDIFFVLDESPATAALWRESTRRALGTYVERGYVVAGFQRPTAGSHGMYLLVQH